MLTDVGDYPATTVAGLEGNTVADGLFHLATLILTVVGSVLLVREWQRGHLAFGALLVIGGRAMVRSVGRGDHRSRPVRADVERERAMPLRRG